jgi:hypothetical protein
MNLFFSILTAFLILSVSACSSAQKPSETAEGPSLISKKKLEQAHESSVDIRYSLDRENFRFTASDTQAQVIAQSYLDKRLLKEGKISRDRYLGFLKKAIDLIQDCQTFNKEGQFCRNPFKVLIQVDQEQFTGSGCRSTDGGALSRLINEGEFLLYSKN